MSTPNISGEPADREQSGLDQMVRHAEEAGLYALPDDPPFERLPVEGSPVMVSA
jgi:hypothetical protein